MNSEFNDIDEASKMSQVSVLDQLDNQTSAQNSGEEPNSESNLGGGSKMNVYKAAGYNLGGGVIGVGNSYHELILHKIVHYNVRKYPDEIITRNVILKG